jgi:hypothetical protein
MFRTRFQKEIVAEFLLPARSSKQQKPIILCDGLPSIPKKQPLAELLSRGGHLATQIVVKKYWREIKRFFDS